MSTTSKDGLRTARYPEDLEQFLDHTATNDSNPEPASSPEPTEDEIARRANQIWRLHGCPQGTAEADWFEAAKQLKEFDR